MAMMPKSFCRFIYFMLFAGGLFYGILLLLAGYFLYTIMNIYRLILLIGLGKLMIFFSWPPLKQVSNGMERFKILGIYVGCI
jgi:hypothetical protein